MSRFKGQTVVCMASGPSLTEEDVALVRASGLSTIVVNATFKLAPWATILYAADLRFWNQYWPKINGFVKSEMWTTSKQPSKLFGINYIPHMTGEGFARRAGWITTGGNSGYQAVHLAATWGASRILLLGYDMQRTGDKEHWHGPHEGNLPNGRKFSFWRRRFVPLARDLKHKGIEVLNCSRETALTCFSRREIEKELARSARKEAA